MQFDLNTIFLEMFLTLGMCVGCFAVFCKIHKNFREIRLFREAYLCGFLGFSLLALQKIIPSFFSFYLANVLVISSMFFSHYGLRRYFQLSIHYRREVWLFLGFSFIFFLLLYVQPHYGLRVCLNSSALGYYLSQAGWLLWRKGQQHSNKFYHSFSILYFLLLGILLIRALLVASSKDGSLQSESFFFILILITLHVFYFLQAIGFSFLISQKQALILEQHLRTKDKVLATMGHDIRTPLSQVSMLAEVALGDPNPDPTLRKIITVSHSGLKLLEELLRWAMRELDATRHHWSPQSFGEQLERALEFVNASAQEKGLRFQQSMVGQQRLLAMQPNIVQTALRNILSNAVKYSPTSQTIAMNSTLGGNRLILVIADQGPGMTSEQIATALAGRQQSSRVGSSGEIGFGFGLAFALQQLREEGAEVRIESTLGEGTRFELSLPLLD